MFFNMFSNISGFAAEMGTLSDAAFHNLLGLLLVVVILRLFLPLHRIMTAELATRNEIVDLAEADGCTEFDIFVRALVHFYGHQNLTKAEKDFAVYLCNWPDNYVLPYYICPPVSGDARTGRVRFRAPGGKDGRQNITGPAHGNRVRQIGKMMTA